MSIIEKIKRVIISCKSWEQLDGAKRYIDLAELSGNIHYGSWAGFCTVISLRKLVLPKKISYTKKGE